MFLWGGATAASQYEGGFSVKEGMDTQDCRPYLPRNNNATVQTRLLTKKVIEESKQEKNELYYPFRVGTKGYEHVKEDLELLKELGIQVYRFSLSWTRLFPKGIENEPNQEGVHYYDQIFDFCNKNKIKIFLTMNHYAVPLYLVEQYGGWTNRDMVQYYLNFAEFVFKRWGQSVDYWLPFNEINAGFFSPYNGTGLIKPDKEDYSTQKVFESLHHQFVANAKTIQLAKKLNVPGKFGAMISCFCYYPLTPKPEDNFKLVKEEQINQWFCSDVLMRGKYPYYMESFFKNHEVDLKITEEDTQLLSNYPCDFISFSYYSSSVVTTEEAEKTAGNLVVTTKNPYLEASEWGWQIDPIGLRTTLNKVYDRYNCPVIISENGFGAKDTLENNQVHDPYRIDYFDSHFKEIMKAKELDNVDVGAYIAWGIIDIVSAGSCEMDKRYGVVYVDGDNEGNGTYKRYKKDSFYWYQKFIQSHNKM
ncbi:hypothetical protein A5844_001701 [Enterococcus sp. 10A9_DIV0425]|uniref:6-phospho-beta-glucosidase n=1 Tax=Candidatus Enterococcus wittei TaxID=1987383 RepID=A0A242JXF9_9ENTE|nr:glycoside hydrolase family 1 protein [Enterococcus sp. 10A9_DIV0425]OTP10004.1 hypothetical protein A5844_001701 [Enterococcus sp. 10A9_DIV0425]